MAQKDCVERLTTTAFIALEATGDRGYPLTTSRRIGIRKLIIQRQYFVRARQA